MGFSTNETLMAFGLIAVIALGFGFATGSFNLSVGGQDTTGNDVRQGTSSTLSVASFNRVADSSTQVAATNYAWKDNGDRVYLGSNSGSASSRSDYTNFVVGDSYEAIAFDSTYTYGAMTSGDVTAEQELVNLDVYEGISSGNLGLTFYDENGDSTSSINLGADEVYGADGIEVSVDANNKAYNPYLIAFEYDGNTDSNVTSVEVANAQSVSCPDSMDSVMSAKPDECYVAFDSNEGEPALKEWQSQETGTITIEADSDGTNGETLEYAVNDLAPYIDSTDEVAFGVEDDASTPSDVGVSASSGSITLN